MTTPTVHHFLFRAPVDGAADFVETSLAVAAAVAVVAVVVSEGPHQNSAAEDLSGLKHLFCPLQHQRKLRPR